MVAGVRMLRRVGENPSRMATVVRWLRERPLFRRDAPVTTARQVIGWWESRRPSYNLIVGCAGILTCVAMLLLAVIAEVFFHSDFGMPDPPIFAIVGVILYGVFANVCYTGGWIVELAVRKLWPDEADVFAKATFSLGLAFSILLTLAPAIVVGGIGFVKFLDRVLNSRHP